MRVLIFFVLLAMLISSEGLIGAMVGMMGGLALDIPITLATGAAMSEIFTGWGLIDDVIMAMLRLTWGLSDRFLLGVAIEESTHLAFEWMDWQDQTDHERYLYSRELQRGNPGQTYVFGDVTHRDIYELGISLGVLGYRRIPRTVFQEGLEWFEEVFA
jgi:hypothetical protein